ncbi:hypothetical protein V8E51_004160 [Hyaloscypha variabilis]
MLLQSLLIATYAVFVSSQVTFNGSEYICPASGGDFCAGPSLSTNIIIRCGSDGLGQPGNCDDNLAGDPPVGVGNSICWQTSLTSGDAACSKNCIVYCDSGDCPEDFTLPDCTPSGVSSSASPPSTTIRSSPASPSTTTQASLPASSTTNTLKSTSSPETSTSIPISTSSSPNSISISSPVSSTTVPNSSTADRSSNTVKPSSGTSTSGSGSVTPGPPPPITLKQGGLSTGAKAGIGVGVSIGVLLLLALSVFAFWYGRRSATQKRDETRSGVFQRSELGPGIPIRRELADTSVPLTAEEKDELGRRRRAAELSGAPINPIELSSERAELQVLREIGNAPVEKE